MSSTFEQQMQDAAVLENEAVEAPTAGAIDEAQLTDEQRILLNTHQDDEETISTEWKIPQYILDVATNSTKIVHSIFPDATPEQLEAIRTQVTGPYADLLNNIAYFAHAATHHGLEHIRKEHVLQPPVRYTLDYALTAVHALVHGQTPGHYEYHFLKNSGINPEDWKKDLPEPSELPPEGIRAQFVTGNILHTGKLCFFSYLTESGDAHVVSDIMTFWSNDLGGWIHTHRVPFWNPIEDTPTEKEEAQVETDGNSDSAASEQSTAE